MAYVSVVVWLMSNGERFLGNKPDNFLMPVSMLTLFVISALITSLLVLGKPIHMYLNGLKKESLILLFSTIAWLVVFLFITIWIILAE